MTHADLDKTYNPHALERDIYAGWERSGYFRPGGAGAPFCIMIPPPNVTGSLHMGHAFQDLIMDALTRFHRMRGDNTLWQAGSDHAGIATQMVVERQLAAEGRTRHDVGREAFVERVWKWRDESGGTIQRQLRRMGASLDWSRERFTMDEGLSRAVREVFVRLYDEGLIYRGKRLVNWDPVLHTAVSDLEVISSEEDGSLWHIRYPRVDGRGHITVATTRPETMLGDTAVAVHPDDERYRDLVGKTVELPLTGRQIPVIADEYVDPEFGSGCVKITPAHDFNDYEVGQRHGLEQINILTPDARVSLPGSPYDGLDRYEARRRIVADLETADLMERIDAHKLMVPRGDRSNAVIEPYLTDQWFVRIAPLAEPAIAAVEDGRIRFVPGNWAKTYFEWMRNIQDWCISRQIWWGHRIPAWYDVEGNIYVARSETEARANHGLGANVVLTQDQDVLDTWFSSALWPFSTLGWPDQTDELATFYPTSVLVTGFDIIFFWVARMIMMGLKFMGDVPFREVYIHGEDVEVQRQCARSIGPHRRHRAGGIGQEAHHRTDAAAACQADREADTQGISRRHPGLRYRRAAFHLRFAGLHRPRHQFRSGTHRGLPQLLQQGVERCALRADEHGRPRLRAGRRRRRTERGRPLDRVTPAASGKRGHTVYRGVPLRPRLAGHVLLHLGRLLQLVPRAVQGHTQRSRRTRGGAARNPPHAGTGV